MRLRILLLILIVFVMQEQRSYALPRRHRPKSCVPKVLLPGHSKPIKCNKARKIKNAYF